MGQDQIPPLTEDETDTLIEAQGAEFEALADYGRYMLQHRTTEGLLAARSEVAIRQREELEGRLVRARGLDPAIFGPHVDTGEIAPRSMQLAPEDVAPPSPQEAREDKDADRERQAAGAVGLSSGPVRWPEDGGQDDA